jgi:hypothetical protein
MVSQTNNLERVYTKTSKDKRVTVVNFAAFKNLSRAPCPHIVTFINLFGHFLTARHTVGLITFGEIGDGIQMYPMFKVSGGRTVTKITTTRVFRRDSPPTRSRRSIGSGGESSSMLTSV